MNLSALEPGLRVPNYRALCNLLEIEPKAGSSKNAQIKEWARYFSWERDKNAYIIGSIYETPLTLTDGRFRYRQYLEPILLHHLAQLPEYVDELTCRNWFVLLCMTDGYLYDEKKCDETMAFFKFHPMSLKKLKADSETKMRNILMGALDALSKQNVLAYQINQYVVETSENVRRACPDEINSIAEVEARVMTEMCISNRYALSVNPQNMKAFREKTAIIYREEFGWKFVFSKLAIKGQSHAIIDRYKTLNIEESKKRLNKEISGGVLHQMWNAVAASDRVIMRQWESLDKGEDLTGFFLHSFFLNETQVLIEELMMI